MESGLCVWMIRIEFGGVSWMRLCGIVLFIFCVGVGDMMSMVVSMSWKVVGGGGCEGRWGWRWGCCMKFFL